MQRLLLIYLCFFSLLISCSDSDVEQIEVVIPKDITVPKGMVYIPEGEFIMGHKDDSKTVKGIKVMSNAFFMDNYFPTLAGRIKLYIIYPTCKDQELQRQACSNIPPKYFLLPCSVEHPV